MVVSIEDLPSSNADSDEDVDDEEWQSPPLPAQRCDAAVRRGDIVGVFDEIRRAAPQLIKHKDEFLKLERVILERTDKAPDDTIDLLLKHGCAVTGYVLMRMRYLLLFQIQSANFLDPGCSTPVYDRVMDVQEHIQRLERHLLDVKQSRAATKRLSELARAKQIENDRLQGPAKGLQKEKSEVVNSHANEGAPGDKPIAVNGHKKPINGTSNGVSHTKRF